MSQPMTSMQRVLAALSHQEPDRVPVFLLLTMHGARELGLPIREYFSRSDHVVEGQLRLRRKFGHDCTYAITYAPVEYEAYGGQALFSDDGPPNSGRPVLQNRADIFALQVPDLAADPRLQRGLEIIRGLAAATKGEAPVIGCVVSPFSIPVMLMGFERYLDLLHDDREGFLRLMSVTTEFAVSWANAQFAAGATALGYFDPLSATDILDEALWRTTGLPIAKATIPRLAGPVALHLASGRGLARVPAYVETGAAGLGASAQDDLVALKRACAGKLSIMGTLNGITLARHTRAEIDDSVRACVQAAGRGGGFVLADNHGEIPFQVPDEALYAVVESARRWGTYPLQAVPHG